MKCSLGISNFLEEISSLSPSIVFLYFLALITEEAFLSLLAIPLELCIQMGISFLFCFTFHFSYFHSLIIIIINNNAKLFQVSHDGLYIVLSSLHVLTDSNIVETEVFGFQEKDLLFKMQENKLMITFNVLFWPTFQWNFSIKLIIFSL